MKHFFKLITVMLIVTCISLALINCNNSKTENSKPGTEAAAIINADPFLSHRDSIPSKEQYNGTLFSLSHDYPMSADPIVNPPWIQALKGDSISSANALAYVDSLKNYVAPIAMKFLANSNNWNWAANGWYQEPWTGGIREALLGTYTGSSFDTATFTSLQGPMTTYVLTCYDKRAAATMGKLWGKTGQDLDLKNNAGQFAEGSVIIKFAFTTANYPEWSVMQNADALSIWDTSTVTRDRDTVYKMRKVSFFQFDIIVKDSKTAPKTGWVFSTLVYDKDAPGKTAWDRMVPLGAMWGNDPNVNSTTNPTAKLYETVINPKAPHYSTETLGWGGRLSGPNDGAIIPLGSNNGKVYTNLQASSCMSCHSVAQDKFASFLLPAPFPTSDSDTLPVFTPGGKEWLRWFQDNSGTVSFDSGQVALDLDMVTAFKSIGQYNRAKKAESSEKLELTERYRMRPKNKYNGR